MGYVDRLGPSSSVLSWKFVTCFAVLMGCVACGGGDLLDEGSMDPGPEAYSLSGEPLSPPPLTDEVRAKHEADLADARETWKADPTDLDATIWFGRRTAYLGHYRDAVAIFTEGLARHPDSHLLLRHRGHRWISLREFDHAIADLERASVLIADLPDEVEPDGLPNARNIPTSTSHSNIWYHLGLAYYLQGDFANAERCYRECLKFSNNPDMWVATSNWLYMTLRRQGQELEALQVLDTIHADMDVIENAGYHDLLLMYRGEKSPADLLPEGTAGADGVQSATVGYGVANWHLYNGREDEARALLERIVAGEQWAAFGFIAAEADLHRIFG